MEKEEKVQGVVLSSRSAALVHPQSPLRNGFSRIVAALRPAGKFQG
jgi:hypothetical protein